jgi:hypothetical protein
MVVCFLALLYPVGAAGRPTAVVGLLVGAALSLRYHQPPVLPAQPLALPCAVQVHSTHFAESESESHPMEIHGVQPTVSTKLASPADVLPVLLAKPCSAWRARRAGLRSTTRGAAIVRHSNRPTDNTLDKLILQGNVARGPRWRPDFMYIAIAHAGGNPLRAASG